MDLTKLCIKEGLWAWKVSLDVYCLDNDGGVIDVGLLAARTRDCVCPSRPWTTAGRLHGRRGETKTTQPRRTGRREP